MATTKPRITVTLDEGVYETLKGLSELQGVSMSSIVSELLSTVDPVQRKVLQAMRHAFALQGSAREDFAAQLDRANDQAEAMALPLFEALDGFAEWSQPPHSNTGVTHPNPPTSSDEENSLKPSSHKGSSRKTGEVKSKNTKTQKHSAQGHGNGS
jgi:hypothetical protein